MVLATDMKFFGKGTPAGQKVVENADVKRRACAVSTSTPSLSAYIRVRLKFIKMLYFSNQKSSTSMDSKQKNLSTHIKLQIKIYTAWRVIEKDTAQSHNNDYG